MPAPLSPSDVGRVALVHDFLLDLRGAERVFLALCELFPEADLFTAIYDEDGTDRRFAGRCIHTSYLQRLRPTARSFRPLLPLYPSAVESLDLSGYDLVISSSSAWAHAVICDQGAVHVCYCHNPFRYAWNDRDRAIAERDPFSRWLLGSLFRRWRQWDWIAAQRVDHYLANSRTTKARIASYFGREATVVHPPVETARFTPGPVGDYYLVLTELMPHKRVDLAVEAFNALRRSLVVVGDGPELRRLRRQAGPTISFAGRVSDEHAAQLLQGCRALVATGVEEFGIAIVEAQAAGRPVVSVRGGGALETIAEGVTGCFWEGDAAQLADAVAGFDERSIDPQACVDNAARFDTEAFRRRLPQEIGLALDGERRPDHGRSRPGRVRRARLGRR